MTDSDYSIKCIEQYMPVWKKRGWRTSSNKDPSHKEQFMEIDDLMGSTFGARLKFVHVKGHAIAMNNFTDQLAKNGSARYLKR